MARLPLLADLVEKAAPAVNGSPKPPSPLAKLSFNFDEALSNCIWFSGVPGIAVVGLIGFASAVAFVLR